MKYIVLFLITFSILNADIPPNYYDGTDGLYGQELKAALNDIISGHTEFSYADVWDALKETDKDPNNPDNVILLYTGWSVANTGYPTWNREHVWAKSHGDFGDSPPCGTDIHHLRPTEPGVNSSRGNKDFDNGGTPHPVATGCYHDSDSWEPRDEVKGDVARMILYMATRYEGENGELDLEAVDAVNTYPEPEHGKLSTLLEWNNFDLPDDFENNRNDVIYENWQGNRNPFVDHPEFVDLIWNHLTIDFTANLFCGEAPLTVDFFDLTNSVGNIISWSWDLDGDGLEDSDLQNPTFTYQEENSYSITLTVEDENGYAATLTKEDFILVGDSNIPIIILDDSFEESLQWTTISLGSFYDWTRTDNVSGSSHPTNVPDGEWFMYMNNYGGNEPAEDWLISPPIDLVGMNDPNISFYAWKKYSDVIPGLELKITENFTGNPSSTIWENFDVGFDDMSGDVWEEFAEIDLAQFTDENIWLAFQYRSTGTGASSTCAWAVDNVRVIGYDSSNSLDILSPPEIALQNYPNPFNPSTTISFSLTTEITENTEIVIYNLKGQKVRTLECIDCVDAASSQMMRSIIWSGRDDNNKPVSSGIYFYQLQVEKRSVASNKMLLIK